MGNITVATIQVNAVVVELDGVIVATQEVPCRRPLKYLLDHPRSKYTQELKQKLKSAGVTPEQICFILSIEPDDGDAAEDKAMDAEDRPDGSHYLDDPLYGQQRTEPPIPSVS